MTAKISIICPDGTEQYAADIELFVIEMLGKLHKHRAKGHWEDIDIHSALGLMHGEVDELEDAIIEKDYEEIHKEAADVANYALILSSVLRREKRDAQMDLFTDG
mgnify:CR=1 FL=1|tara:strand:- start:5334 stop:5648 length:315 start_codon:yes stop_codon:yes gene_type:complete